ncbi:YceI family protein [Nitriliruptor alkaliphilus]|uniref:YceI family protein n=1 Tax=Nitriliruptor alkaliphilus TaxID=427918 RepID=UPI0006985817|nr:YceI family protein [Nitriliruptor alkaliphilus]
MSTTTTTPLATGTWTIDPSHTTVGFVVRHLGFSKVRGGFNTFEGTIEVAEDLAASTAQVTIQADSFDSGDEGRDQHVRAADFLDVDNHPTLTFVTTGIRHEGGSAYVVTGDLTIRGVTQQVDLATEFLGTDTDPFGNVKAGFEATTEIDREAFGLTWNAALESGGVLVGKKVQIVLEVQATRA